jgi:hypothetical protein
MLATRLFFTVFFWGGRGLKANCHQIVAGRIAPLYCLNQNIWLAVLLKYDDTVLHLKMMRSQAF